MINFQNFSKLSKIAYELEERREIHWSMHAVKNDAYACAYAYSYDYAYA